MPREIKLGLALAISRGLLPEALNLNLSLNLFGALPFKTQHEDFQSSGRAFRLLLLFWGPCGAPLRQFDQSSTGIGLALCKEYAELPGDGTKNYRDWLAGFDAYVQENIGSDVLNISYMASHFAMSESSFCRQVSRLTGLSPKQYLQEVRLDLARQLLENRTCRTVAQVADKAGFSNYRTFSRSYKSRFGKSPAEHLSN